MQTFYDWAVEYTRLPRTAIEQIVESIVVIFIILLIRYIALRVLRRRIKEVKRHYYWRRTINYAAAVLLIMLVGRIWFTGLQDIGTFLGLIAAGLVIAVREPLLCLAGWMYIMTRRPYAVGDRIEVGDLAGDVIDIRLFQTYVMEIGKWVEAEQATGRIALIPNSASFISVINNYTYGFEHIWDEVSITITFESDWRRAREIMSDIGQTHGMPMCQGVEQQIRKAASEHMIFFDKLTPIVYTSVLENGIRLTLRYLTPPRQRRGNAQKMWEAILDAISKEPAIQWAYPTTRFFRNPEEGKSGTRPDAEVAARSSQ